MSTCVKGTWQGLARTTLFERLERRDLMAVDVHNTPEVTTVRGDDSVNQVVITQYVENGVQMIRISDNGNVVDRVRRGKQVDVFLEGGNDTLAARTVSTRILVHAGAGNDTIRTGSGSDIVFGGDGNDRIYSDSGNDRLYGGRGADHLRGGAGADWFYGEQGGDYINMRDGDARYDRNRGVEAHDIVVRDSLASRGAYIDFDDHRNTVYFAGKSVELRDAPGEDLYYLVINGESKERPKNNFPGFITR